MLASILVVDVRLGVRFGVAGCVGGEVGCTGQVEVGGVVAGGAEA